MPEIGKLGFISSFANWGWQFVIHCIKQACQKILIINFIYQQHLFCSLIG